ncbi:primosomal replication protein N [Sulfuricystis multivorans]|uniref:primosomal replication protein N n=1 Tax=Sulfuricystis multivorans TaxID=2211108 RepID=UPI0024E016E3|nr:primosomal replication protein N [Sulfuricystis multivorans]
MQANHTELAGVLQEFGPLRHTPAGIPVIEFMIVHDSEQLEAGDLRRVTCEIACVALGTTALLIKEASPGSALKVSGFLASRSLKRKTPVLHVIQVEFFEKF